MEKIILNDYEYTVKKDEFQLVPHAEYNNLRIYPKVGELERIVGLINDLTENQSNTSLAVYGWNYGGFVPVQCSKIYDKVYVYSDNNEIPDNLPKNITFNVFSIDSHVIYISEPPQTNIILNNSFVICSNEFELNSDNFMKFPLYESNVTLYVPKSRFSKFYSDFYYYFDENKNFKYDNLIHLCIMVKNAGPLFEQVLTENLPIIDRWTILDTGSTDGTQDIVRKVLKNKKGNLYEEPFINFRDSRNRCLDLAGKYCKYLLMLDDTYAIRDDLRKFLTTVRGDQFASSYSLLIISDDSEYYSNRVTMSEKGFRYIYTIHEVIQFEKNELNVVIPKEAAYIMDHRAPYMEKRTMDRKKYDLQLLHDMVRDDPTNPRHYYYLAQTYNLLEDYENALYWFKKRATTELKGHEQEAVDAWFEYGRICNFKLNRSWEECKEAYEKAYERDSTRPEPLYFIGIHYYLNKDMETAYNYFRQAFVLGYPIHAQFSLKPTLVFHFLPKFLAELCYKYNDWQLGLEASKRFLENNKPDADSYSTMVSWFNIFKLLCTLPISYNGIATISEKQLVVFVADGGWGNWTGSDILTKGVGGSETYIIEIARWVQANGNYNCVVFCRCEKEEVFEGVRYIPIEKYTDFILKNHIHTTIISRYSEYIPLSLQGNVENLYLVLHDIGPSGNIIPKNDVIKKVLCLTDWHKDYFISNFPDFKEKTDSFYYGIDRTKFKPSAKVKNSFIYSSFPNRGLLPLLMMWRKIKQAIPDATLHVYSDINGKWVNEVAKDQMDAIRSILAQGIEGVIMHGWVSKEDLAKAWSTADIWLYPCIFSETFCLTALEAAASKTLAIGTPLAALTETIGDRGILIDGNPLEQEWQDKALDELLSVLQDPDRKNNLLDRNYAWASSMSWRQRGSEFISKYLNLSDSEGIIKADMLNWTDDLPKNGGHKQLFEEALAKVNPKKILEIGTFTGTSLIHMLKMYPDATGIAVDKWENYNENDNAVLNNIEENNIEKVFHENVRKSHMTNRIQAIKGDSAIVLAELLKKNEQFDFIYVDGSHKCLDCYADIVFAWNLLQQGGILAVDDVFFNYNEVQNGNLLGYPLKAKEHFMNKFKGQYEVVSDSYRLFVKKL